MLIIINVKSVLQVKYVKIKVLFILEGNYNEKQHKGTERKKQYDSG